ncbi:hypothetical protein UUU_26030 (plasmid) [Klebsiella pneumoniae subsp. pneumoniae DSM 30104 = JCM 1662 = NBRC 14940]|nr:hypothetical protein UUU_26030 [Klebsiella pneumoniae subsp. pneumoniae DSM 30104 = JCM 1662 = NBRC 14940]
MRTAPSLRPEKLQVFSFLLHRLCLHLIQVGILIISIQ